MKKILMPCLVPFWRRSTGAEQRIFSLVQALQRRGDQVRTFYPLPVTADDEARCQDLDVLSVTSADLPEGVWKRIAWTGAAIANQVTKAWRTTASSADETSLDDYRWPWAGRAFSQAASDFAPDVVLCQYVTTAWLLEHLPAVVSSRLRTAIDTHDVLHRRCELFERQGQAHWIRLTRHQESRALAAFDVVIAIEASEADDFRQMAPQSQVIVVGHQTATAINDTSLDSKSSRDSEGVTFGYIASANASNVAALTRLLENVWLVDPLLRESNAAQLVIAGRVVDGVDPDLLDRCRTLRNVTWIGHVDSLEDFYGQIDVALNPVSFGTGLKIKSVEASSFGVPIITTDDNQVANVAHRIVCESLQEMRREMVRLVLEPGYLGDISAAAASEVAASAQRDDLGSTYQPLFDAIDAVEENS